MNDQFAFINPNVDQNFNPFGHKKQKTPTVFEQAKKYNNHLQLCHRLDKETSGVLLLSKHADAYSHAAQAFEKRTIKKIYHAISHGNHSFDDFKVDLPLVTTRSGRSAGY